MPATLTLAVKDVRLLFRDRFGMFWVLAFPLLYSVFFGMIFGSSGDGTRGSIPVAVVDEDRSDGSARLVEFLANHESIRVAREDSEEGVGAPVLSSLDDARDAVRRGSVVAYLRIPEGYGDEPFAMFAGGDDTPQIELGLDPARKAESGMLQGVLMGSTFEILSDGFLDRDQLTEQIAAGREEVLAADDIPATQRVVLTTFFAALDEFVKDFDLDALEEEDGGEGGFAGMDPGSMVDVVEVARDRSGRPRSSFEITFPQAIVWGLMSVAMGFAVTFVRERSGGTLLRLSLAPISQAQLMAGKAIGCFVTAQIVMGILIAVATIFLGVRVSSPGLMLLATSATAVAFTGLMMTASVLGKTEQAVAGAAWGLMMPFAMIGGGMIPLIAMPDWLVGVSDFSPFKWAILALEGAVWRDYSFEEMLKPCGILCATGVAFFAIGTWVYSRGER